MAKLITPLLKTRLIRTVWSTKIKRKLCYSGLFSNYCWNNINPSFIIGTGRMGTKFLAYFFNTCFKNTVSLHEPSPILFNTATDFLNNRISLKDAMKSYDIQRIEICNSLNKKKIKNYIESNHNLSDIIPVVNAFYDNVKFIYIIRNGVDVVRSYYSKLNPKNDDSIDKKLITKVITDRINIYSNSISLFECACRIWVTRNQYIQEYLTNDIDCITIRFEDIFNNKHKGIYDIIDFLDLNDELKITKNEISQFFSKKMNRNKKYLLPETFEKWPEEKKEIFINTCGEYMEKMGYTF